MRPNCPEGFTAVPCPFARLQAHTQVVCSQELLLVPGMVFLSVTISSLCPVFPVQHVIRVEQPEQLPRPTGVQGDRKGGTVFSPLTHLGVPVWQLEGPCLMRSVLNCSVGLDVKCPCFSYL